MGQIIIDGGCPLRGELEIQSAKNSVLPILAAAILCGDVCRIEKCPRLTDVECAGEILRHLGAQAYWEGRDFVVDSGTLTGAEIPEYLMRKMRSSVIFLGAILGRCGECRLSYPGGCELGPRPIDLHLDALRALGAEITEGGGLLNCTAQHLRGEHVVLAIPSVGATENAMLCAVNARGTTVISNAAREPEIVDLQNFLQKMGANVSGAGGDTITVVGGAPLHGCSHRCIGDRIVASTYLCAAAATMGDVTLRGVDPAHLSTVLSALRNAGSTLTVRQDLIRLESEERLRSVPTIRTSPYPGFPTDAQAVLMAAMLKCRGTTVFVENIFESRYGHVSELRRMGAHISVEGRVAVVSGTEHLYGARVQCPDLRGGAALVIAGLQAQGQTVITLTHHIERGYENITEDLSALGAAIRRS